MNDAPVTAEPQWDHPWSQDDGEARAREFFTSRFGEMPRGVWSAPGRVNLIGEHTDHNLGLCLPTVLRHGTYVAAGLRTDDSLRVVSSAGGHLGDTDEEFIIPIDEIAPGAVSGWQAYPAGVVWALRERGFDGVGIDLAIVSCVPPGAGLASSAALEVATALAVNELWRLALNNETGRSELAEACMQAESEIVGTPAGGLDQYTILFCEPGSALEIDFASTPPGHRSTPMYFPEYGLEILIVDTRAIHDLRDGRYAQRFEECQAAAEAAGVASLRELADAPDGLRRANDIADETLRKRARHVVNEIDRVRRVAAELAGTGPAHERLVEVGSLLYRSHTSLAVDFEVSCAELDLAVHTAWTGGALGARLIGGGFGGSTIALLRRTHVDITARAVDAAFQEAGMERPRFLRL